MTTASSGRLLGNTVIRADGEAWRSAKDYSWMLKNKPTTLPFYVTDENVHNYQKLAIS